MQHDASILVEDLVLPTLEIGVVQAPPLGKSITWLIALAPDGEAFATINEYGLVFNGYL